MDIFLSKLLPLFIYPLGFSIWLVILATLFLNFRKRFGLALLSLAIVILWVSSTPVFSEHLRARLERVYHPVSIRDLPEADAIVILGGAVGAVDYPRVEVDLSGASDRVLHAARLYRAGKAPVVIAVGGRMSWNGTSPESLAMWTLLQEWGVPEEAIILEDKSVNTYQNAVNTKRLMEELRIKCILLVTSAIHMPRALATFHAAGIDAVLSPTDYEIVDKKRITILDFLPDAEALVGTTRAMTEYMGLVVYKLRGWIL